MRPDDWNDIFSYKDGLLYWKIRTSIKSRKAPGDIAGSVKNGRYSVVQFMGNNYLAHRVIWEMHHGEITEGMHIDHINHERSDNRIENLRLVTNKQNRINQRMDKRNSTGKAGVYWHKSQMKWIASIGVNGKNLHLGTFSNFESASKARRNAEIKYGFHENHGK